MTRMRSRRMVLALVLLLVASMLPVLPLARAQEDPGATLADAELAQAITETEPNNTAETAQLLPRIGRENPVQARIDAAGDRDWFSFAAVEGRTYTVELLNVATSLNGSGFGCSGSGWAGVGMFIFNPLLGTAIAGDCRPLGSTGNIHASAQFTADTTGTFYIHILANNSTQSGTYSLRILPRFGESGASWDSETFEPNNRAANAYAMTVGREHAIRSTLEPRSSNFTTYAGDEDWYRFEAVEGRTYTVELLNVAISLNGSGFGCSSSGWAGVGMFIFNPLLGTAIAGDCRPLGSTGNIHASAQFTADTTGTFYIRILANSSTQSGTYSLRILPRFGEPGASWDNETFEPNNRAANAYAITVGREHAIRSTLEPRSSNFTTYAGDVDWYRFEAVEGRTYTVELLNVATSLNDSGFACNNSGWAGVSLLIFNPLLGTAIAGDCRPRGSAADVHASAQFTADSTGTFYIRILANNSTQSGTYSLRILPRFGEPGASWDNETFEPNNSVANAYPIGVGSASALRATIEPRSSSFTTYFSDVDWYRFEAVEGRTYVIELFNVATTLGGFGFACSSGGGTGLSMLIFSPALDNTPVAGSCGATERSGSVHSRAQFQALSSGTYYVRLFPNNIDRSGPYSLRVCEGACLSRVYLPLTRR